MDVSRQLLHACDRRELYDGAGGEIAGTESDILMFGDHALARRILRRRGVRRLPVSRAALEAKIQRAIAARDPGGGMASTKQNVPVCEAHSFTLCPSRIIFAR